MPKLTEESYANVGRVLANISTVECGLRILKDLTEAQDTNGALQRTIIDRVLALLIKTPTPPTGSSKRKHEGEEENKPLVLRGKEDDDAESDDTPKRSERPKKPTEKAKEYI